jgi:murein DD-endopeptidase MepM/ murein hydrolase activator NlpD
MGFLPALLLILAAAGLPAPSALLFQSPHPSSGQAFRLLAVGFGWPLQGARVVRRFDPPPQPWLAGHRGVDLSGSPGIVVRAAGEGTIVYVGEVAGRGVVSVSHPGGLRTTYEPVLGRGLSVGDSVAAGQEIGTLGQGHPGCLEAACLHWGLRRGSDYLDPLVLLGLGRVRLLPL